MKVKWIMVELETNDGGTRQTITVSDLSKLRVLVKHPDGGGVQASCNIEDVEYVDGKLFLVTTSPV